MSTLRRLAIPGLLLALACGGLPEPKNQEAKSVDYLGQAPVGPTRDAGPVPEAEVCATDASKNVCETLLKDEVPTLPPGVELNCYCTWETSNDEISFHWGHKKVTIADASERSHFSTPLYLAVDLWRSPEVVGDLLAAGAHPDLPYHPRYKDSTKRGTRIRPLSLAIEKSRVDMTRDLLEAGADLALVQYGSPGPASMVFLIQHGVAPDAFPAPIGAKPAAVAALIEVGFPLTKPTPQGTTLLHEAAKNGDAESVRLLLDAGVDVNLRAPNGSLPLHYAALVSTFDDEPLEVARLLLERGADPLAKDGPGETARESAEGFGYAEMAELLKANGG